MVSETFPPLAESLTDFNDLAAAHGLDDVRDQIEQAQPVEAPAPAAAEPARAPEWPMPMVGGAVPPDIRADVLPGWLGEFVGALCVATQTPPAMAVGFALSVLAACVQRRYVVQVHEGYTEPSPLWSLTVAPSGSRKSAIKAALVAPLEAWERRAGERMRREIADNNARIGVAEAIIKRLEGQAGKAESQEERDNLRKQIADVRADMPAQLYTPRAYVNESTTERVQAVLVEQQGRCAALSDEGGLLNAIASNYGGGGGPSLDVLLQGYSGGDVRVERVSRKAYITRAAVTLGLMLQPDLLNEAAGSNKFKASGLMARFCYFLPPPFVGSRDVRRFAPVPQDLRDRYARCIDELMPDPMQCANQPPTVVALEPHALELWFDFAQECETGLAEGGALSAIPDFGAKLAGTAARIALLFELVMAGPTPQAVGADSMERAIALCQLLVPHARAAYRLLAADEADRDADHILQWIVRSGQRDRVLQSEVHRALHSRFTKRERLVSALQRLQASACLRHTTVKNQGARASDVWLINPRVYSENLLLQ